MLSTHIPIFEQVAEDKKCWIGLREPNRFSADYYDKPNYVSKRKECGAKTADNPSYLYKGLVVSPLLRPDAFVLASLNRAKESWHEFTTSGVIPAPFKMVTVGPEMGLVLDNGNYIFADYDLMAVHPSNSAGEWLPVAEYVPERPFDEYKKPAASLERLCIEVEKALNDQFVKKMVHHGSELIWTGKKIGFKDDELILWFGPGGRMVTSIASVQDPIKSVNESLH